jgi:acetolactate synthase-1/2/3 large subunit
MTKQRGPIDRRQFLSGVAVVGAGAGLTPIARDAAAQEQPPVESAVDADKLSVPPTRTLTSESGALAVDEGPFIDHPNSDFMVDVLNVLEMEYVATTPGSTFRAIHESIINHGGNRNPELLTCLHEEIGVAMAHGYSKVNGKVMGVLCHGTVGLQHAAMAVYNAWCDHVPVMIIAGNHADASLRSNWVNWAHSAQDAGALLRDCTKWDDAPTSLGHFALSAVRAHTVATTPPMAPVVLVVDADLQEEALRGKPPYIPRTVTPTIPQGDGAALDQVAQWLVAADRPVIAADRLARTAKGMGLLVELAEALQAPVVDLRSRLNFPTTHYLNQTASSASLFREADVILALEVIDVWGLTHRIPDRPHTQPRALTRDDVKLITIGLADHGKANYQDFQRYAEPALSIAGDGEESLPYLIESVRRALPKRRAPALRERRDSFRRAHQQAREQSLQDAARGWDAKPISVARMCAELWQAIRGEDWALVSDSNFQSEWQFRLWDFDKPYQFIGGSGAAGLGYNAPAAVGAALAHRPHGRLAVNIQGDGDLMFVPGALWTAAHHRIPLLTVVHNNRAYFQEVMHVQRMANRHQRGVTWDHVKIGTAIDDPAIDFSKLAQSMGMWAAGPIIDAKDLLPALQQAIKVVKAGAPALIDVVSQGR